MSRTKTYGFIDASNIIYGAKAERWYIDHKNPKQVKFIKKLETSGIDYGLSRLSGMAGE